MLGWWPNALLAIAFTVLAWGWSVYSVQAESNPTFAAALAGATIAATAIIYSAHQTHRVQTIRYTLDALSQRFNNQSYIANARIFSSAGADQTLSSVATLAQLRAQTVHGELVSAMAHMLNYWEFLATAYTRRHLDRRVFEETVSDLILDLVEPCASMIADVRHGEPSNYENLLALFYCFAPPARRAKIIPLLGPAPYPLCDADRMDWVNRYEGTAFAG